VQRRLDELDPSNTMGGSCSFRGPRAEPKAGQIREGYAYLLLTGAQRLRIASSDVDSEGRFELSTRAPGRYRLVVHAGPQHHRYRLVTDLVTLVPGETVWERSLTLDDGRKRACVSIASRAAPQRAVEFRGFA
jgi:hypothetical protein